MELPTTMVPSGVRVRLNAVRVHRAHRYRALLLRDLGNNRLRKRYLDYRTAEFAHADLRLANRCLAAAGAIMSTIVLILVGALGGVVAVSLLANNDRPAGTTAVGLAVGVGCALCGAFVFAGLTLRGWVLFADLLAEYESVEESSGGSGRAITAALIEAWGGLLWGTVFGISIGAAAALLCGTVGLVPADWGSGVAVGAAGALAVGALASTVQCLAVRVRGPNDVARAWARLGPLPLVAYLLSCRFARRKYLR